MSTGETITVADIAYIVLSDLHLGAANSILSHLVEGDPDQVRAVDLGRTSPVLVSMVDCLRSLVEGLQAGPAKLVLAGDVLDLALSTDKVAETVFEMFARAVYGADGPPSFGDSLFYVPGNHDHHMWETAREGQYVAYVQSQTPDAPLREPWHSTRMLAVSDRQAVRSPLMAALLRRSAGRDVDVQVVYPNLALSVGGDNCVVIHHGHFTEAIYTLMSELKDLMFPNRAPQGLPHVWEWEAENFAWIDFFWGMLGRSGDVGSDVGLVYAQLASDRCVDHYLRNIVGGLVDHERAPHWFRGAETSVLAHMIDWLVDRRSTLERASPAEPLSDKGWAGLDRYLTGPVLDQIEIELPAAPARISFVFGHTHKPFEQPRSVSGFRSDIDVYNTGGWVVDTDTPSAAHGGSAVLISDDLQVASLRMFNQTDDGAPSGVTIAGTSPWADELRARVDLDREPWPTLARVAAEAVIDRHRLSAAYLRLC